MEYGRTSGGDDYYRRGRSPSPRIGRYRNDNSRRNDRSYSPQHQNWSHNGGRRGRSPERYSSSWRRNSRSPVYHRSRSRSSSREMRRSRSGSRGHNRYRDDSRSPRQRSRRRSSSYGSRKRFKRGSSSSSRSRSRSRSRSGSRRKKQEPKEDFFKSMYADEEPEQPQGYLHPALSRSAVDVMPVQSAHAAPAARRENVAAHTLSNTAGFAALNQAYGGNSPKRPYAQEIDDEDRFLYGDDDNAAVQNPPTETVVAPVAPPPVAPQPAVEKKTVTPGGFDSNALKNVLKAIGFDFEMSAQNSSSKAEDPVKPAPVVQSRPVPQQPMEVPQHIQTIQTVQVPKVVQAPPSQAQAAPSQQYYQPYDPYDQNKNVAYTPQPVQAPPQVQPTPLGYPMTVADPNNPGSTLLVYRPIDPTVQSQVAYQQQTAPVHPQQPAGRIVLPPQRSEPVTEVKKSEKELRQERLNYLQQELEKLKKQQNELLRKKRREKDGHKDPLIKKNTLLQAGVEEQIREITQAAERAAGINSESSDDDTDQKPEEKEAKYEYVDPGNHWCRLCNIFSTDLTSFLSHLHSKTHRKAVDPYNRPWDEGDKKKKQKNANRSTKSVKGAEFLIPVTGYYCTICQTFSGDQICADDHLKSYPHNAMYKKHCKKNPSYEKKYKKKKKAALEEATNGEKKKDVKQETEVKFISTPVKIEKKEPQWVEKSPPKYVEQQVKYVGQKSFEEKYEPEKKKEKKHKTDREHSQEMEKERGSRRGTSRRSFEESSYYREEPKEEKPPKKYSDEYAEQSRPADHGRRKKHWSPGYDEYERQQQDRYDSKQQHEDRYDSREHQEDRFDNRDKRHNEEKKRHSRSRERDRGGRWVEKPAQEDISRRSERGNKENITAGSRIPTPGFGKFKWNSAIRSEPSRFDQVPVDTHVPARETIDNKNGEFSSKGKIAIKITGKTQYPQRLSSSSALSSKSSASAEQEKRAAMAIELQKKVEALKRENALRNQLSSITLPSSRGAKQPKPNTAAVMLGTRSIGKHNTLLLAKSHKSKGKKDEEEVITHEIEADVSPPPPPVEDVRQPPPPGEFEPPPPGEEEFDLGAGAGDDGANSEASGISMELASDED